MSDLDHDAGEVVLHQSLLQPRTLLGLPEKLAKIIWIITAGFVMGARVWWLLAVAIPLHAALAFAFSKDPHIFEVAWRALRAQRRLEP